MSNRAWVTLATNDSYSLGALVLANSLRRAASAHPAVVLITPSVTEPMRERLHAVFAEVILVDVMDSKDAAHLALLQRPELGITFTKIHCWNLTQYEKCVFLDADTLVVQNCDELFDRSELSAAPDVGWPDCFNSGVFVFSPSADTFSKLVTFAAERGSFDGGDQGLLNSYFSDWAHGDISKHLPFLYNVTSAAFYSYIPALKHYGQNLKIIHFIGAAKPWLQPFNWQSRSVEAPEHLKDFLQLWWDLFVPQVHSQLDTQMANVEQPQVALGPEEIVEYNEPVHNYGHYEPALDSSSEFPWHRPDNQIQDSEYDVPDIDIHQFHDPWNVYRGSIPPSIEETTEQKDNYQEVRQYAWDYTNPHGQNLRTDNSHNYEQHADKSCEQQHSQSQNYHRDIWHYTESQPSQDTQHFTHLDIAQQQDHHHTPIQESFYHHDHYRSHDNHQHLSEYHHDRLHFDQSQKHTNNFQETLRNQVHFGSQHDSNLVENTSENNEPFIHNSMKNLQSTYSQFKKHNREELIYTVMMDHERIYENHRKSHIHVNGCEFESDNDIDVELNPRHPYDGFYLRHLMTIDSRGRKVCTHEIPFLPPSPTPSLESSMDFEDAIDDFLEDISFDRLNGEESQAGVAGRLARVVAGAPQQQDAVDELTRRQGWEAGNIDYMGADSFDNIWAKISQTLSQPPSSPPRQPSPPKEQKPVEEAKEVKEAPVEQVESKPEESTKGTSTEAPSEAPVAAEAPVVVSVPVVSSEDSISSETIQTVAPTEVVETAAPAETIECIPSPEATACVSIPEATECISPPEASIEPVAPIEAAESVPSSEASETVAPNVAADSVSPSDVTEIAPVAVLETVSLPEATVNVASIEASENVSSPEAANVAPIEAIESISTPELTVNVAPTEATESLSSPEAPVSVEPTEASESLSSPDASVNVAPTEATENVSSPEATVSVTPTEATETAPSETKETVAPSETPAPAAPVEEPVPVDIPVPANEAAESAGKPEDPIPVPVEAAITAPIESKEEITPSIDIPVAAVEALKMDDACAPAPQVDTIISETPAPVPAPIPAPAVEAPAEPSLNISEVSSKQSLDKAEAASDSPPLASTPAKEEIPLTAAKTEERRKPAGKLTLHPPAPCDALPTPDSELEDAAALAHAIIAGELRTPTVTSPTPPALSSPPEHAPLPPRGLSVDQPEVPTPPVEASPAVSLSQIGVKSKPSIASQIETSVKSESAPTSPEASEAPKAVKSDAPKKKIVKKVVKKVVDKEGGASSDAPVPVPPPRKKEKKPKEK